MGPISIPLGLHHNGIGCQDSSSHFGGALGRTNEQCGIREVWAHNLEKEFATICQVGITEN